MDMIIEFIIFFYLDITNQDQVFLIFLMAVAATIVMLCFSHVWPDMQRCHERESEMDFKAETSKVLRGARACPVLLVEEDLET